MLFVEGEIIRKELQNECQKDSQEELHKKRVARKWKRLAYVKKERLANSDFPLVFRVVAQSKDALVSLMCHFISSSIHTRV